jgi:autotransporter-associated beta strand protein
VQGTGTLTLATSNTYTGGTIVNSGTLAINNGGNGTGPCAIGMGPLTLNAGATLDNTSGSNVTLNAPVPENWNGNFSFAGTTNLGLGSGTVTLGASAVQVTVLSNTLACDGAIVDGGQHYQLTLQGPGALTLNGQSTFLGGMNLNSGKLNINNPGDGGADSAIGFGPFNINGGTIDNTSGSNIVFTTGITEYWNAGFTFAGSADLDMGPGTLVISTVTLTLQNGATFASEGGVNAAGSGGLATLTLSGNGRFRTSGDHGNTSATTTGLSAVVNSGVVFQMDKSSDSTVHSTLNLVVNSNGTAVVTGTGGHQIGTAVAGTVTLSGGTLDLNGSSESVFAMTFNSGTLENSSNSTAATLTMVTNINVKSTNCFVDVTTNSSLDIAGTIIGAGGLVKTDNGALHLDGTNTYTGPTVVSNGLLSLTTATSAGGDYTVASGELEAILDPAGAKLQMSMGNLTFATGTRMEFDLASGSFGDTTSSLVAADSVTMNGNVAVDVTNAPADTADDVLLTYTNRQGSGSFVAGNIPVGAYIYDNKATGKVNLTYTAPPPPPPTFTSVGRVFSGGALSGLTFSGVGGPPNGTYHILSSTNVALHPLSAWTVVKSGNFDSSGNFSNSVSVNPGTTRTFYALSVP